MDIVFNYVIFGTKAMNALGRKILHSVLQFLKFEPNGVEGYLGKDEHLLNNVSLTFFLHSI